jgi:hypothetical protein
MVVYTRLSGEARVLGRRTRWCGVLGRAGLPISGVVSSLAEANLYTAHPVNHSRSARGGKTVHSWPHGCSASGLVRPGVPILPIVSRVFQ